MKALRHLYRILTYVMFTLPPFIWGLVLLYADQRADNIHVISLIVNVFVLLFGGLIVSILMKLKKLHVPSQLELKYLLFGLVGNVVVYLYTFQNDLEIRNVVTIYLVLLIVLFVRYILITKKITVWELWILLPIYLVIDTIHFRLTGCGVTTDTHICYDNPVPVGVLYLLYVPIVLSTVGYYGYKIYQYKRYTFFGIAHMVLIGFIVLYAQELVIINEKLMGTISILAAFLVVLDFIVSIINRTYTHRLLMFYLRTGTFLVIGLLVAEEQFFHLEATKNMLALMVFATYASLFINILKSLLHITEEADQQLHSDISYIPCTEELKKRIKEQFGKVAHNHISLDDHSFALVAQKDDEIVGFISSYLQPLYPNLKQVKEAYINIIEVAEPYRMKGIASELIRQTEMHFKHQGASQIRAWSSSDKKSAILMWNAIGYTLSPTTIVVESTKLTVSGVYATKSL